MADPNKPSLTDYHYGGHSAVRDDRSNLPEAPAGEPSGMVKPQSHDNLPTTPYVPSGGKEPEGVERYGMYGVAPGASAPEPLVAGTRPVPGPASLGQYDNRDMDAVAPLSDLQRREVLDERLAAIVDPGVVTAEFSDGACTLHGTVRDAATRDRVEALARESLPGCEIRNELALTSVS
ncbi:BON domain-containing protein [Cupriavidus agavae]|uniref:BON domain-containing protein n=1 Tax=Cupriavidus agavae TaxID=1001822 RepID=A0A4Q7S6U7_9BURK|nr:BON domain-containing protein [Cupriavidus agavae]RZT42106.1 hypothetical protein EV147_1124 [Cupriavidus agavae]